MRLLLFIWLAASATCVTAQGLDALKQPGVVALMRHALAPGTGDPAGFAVDDCNTQRNLDARGRDQARSTGDALRDAGVTFDQVWTSQWCRARDTAVLMEMGDVEEKPPLNSFFAGRGDRAAQTAAALDLIAELPEGDRLLIVTHQVNITALTGRGVGSGEIIVTRRKGDGLEMVDRFLVAP
ncbi:Phosphohistidine phosphatase SixA [Roseovarius tolerans]|uniref:Phosphohistidine phosphatase SixA n=1 Tax=Roseovarius tolerans TaxID=74031 RepID=A0A1H7VM36_9RHOB|nr:histidine phosphatase family protein [Roseovarius tolerans]SEM09848.1 Phosphohistidine phosphatase SixA [Roseovarius tolerans]